MNKKLFVLAAMSTLILAGCKTGGDTPAVVDVAVSGISLNKEEVVLNVRGSETLVATVNPDNATNKEVTWTIEDQNIATVDQTGKVTGVEFGETSLKVTSKADATKFALCRVIVGSKPKVELINALTNLGENVEADVSVKAGTPDWDGTEVPEARTYKLHTNKDYNYIEGVAGVVRLETKYEDEVVDEGYYFAENVEDTFSTVWGKVYDNHEQYELGTSLKGANAAIKSVASTEFIYSSKTGKYTVINGTIVEHFLEVAQVSYITNTKFSSVGIYINGADVKVDFCKDTKANEAVATYTFKGVEATEYAALEEFAAVTDAPLAPLSADEVAYLALLKTSCYRQRYDFTEWAEMFDLTMGGVETYITPNTQTVIHDNFDWTDGVWEDEDLGVVHTALQLAETGYTLSRGSVDGGGVTPEDFENVEFTTTDDPEVIQANLDFGLLSPYTNPQNFADSGYFNIFRERFDSKLGQVYQIKPGDKIYSSTGEEDVVDQELLEYVAMSFDLFYNMFNEGYVMNLSPNKIKSISLVPYYKDDIETPENLEEIAILMDADYYFMELRLERDEDGKPIRDDDGYVIPILDDEGHYIWDEVTDDAGNPYGVVASGIDATYFDKFDEVDQFYRVSGLVDAAVLREYYQGTSYLFPDDMKVGEKVDFFDLTNLVDETNVSVIIDNGEVATLTYDEETGLYTITATATGTVTVKVLDGEEVLAEYEVEIKAA